MKLKQFIIPVAGALLLGGCEADHRNDNLLDSVVYLLESDLQKALFYDIEETIDYSFRAFSSGYTVTPSELGIELSDDVLTAYNEANGTAYTALDPACYRLVNSTGSVDADHPLDDVHRAARLLGDQAARRSDVLRHPAAPDLLLFEGKRGARQHPDQSRDGGDQVLVRNAGVVECDLGSSQTLDFTAYVEFDNKWETTTEYVYGDEVLDAYNAEHGTNYLPIPTDAVTFTPAQLEVGKREAVSHFEIDKSKLTPDRFYTLAVQLKSNSEFKIGADNTVLYHIALNPLFTDRSKWILVACSSWYTGRGPELTIDGDVSTKFENRYNDIGQGDIETLPVTIDWDLGKTCYYAGMKLTRRNDSYVTDLKAGWIEMSDDGKTWMPLQSFDFEGSKTVVGDFRSEQWFGAGRYLRLKMTESGRPGRKLVSVCEFEPVLIDAGE
ncbi:MAG: BT_3987 domain-containing protein [Alistipes communis]